MKITVLGTRGEIPENKPYHSKHSGLLVDNELLIDVGEKEFLKLPHKNILISHFHPDHAFFVRRGHEELPETTARIYGPEKFAKYPKLVSIVQDPIKIGSFSITPIPVHHSKLVTSLAYVVRKKGQSFLYTGDLVWIDKQYHSAIGEVDLVITEASFLRKGGMIRRDAISGQIFGHNGIPNLISLLKPFAKRILFMHFGSWFYKNTKEAKDKLIALAKEQGMEAIVGYDGLEIDLSTVCSS